MKKNFLLRTNLLVCLIIVIGFLITSLVSYKTNIGVFERDVENVSMLAADGMQNRIEALFIKPVNVSLTLANDTLLKQLLSEENPTVEDPVYVERIQEYLNAYRLKYGYDSVFLVSTKTNRYYHFTGIHRILRPDDPENIWYFDFLDKNDEYSLNVDNDQAAGDSITVFINCAITDQDGTVMGVIGVGFQVRMLQQMLADYDKRFDVQAHLIDSSGIIEVSHAETGHENISLLKREPYASLGKSIFNAGRGFWYKGSFGEGYLVTRSIPSLRWELVVDNNTAAVRGKMVNQVMQSLLIISLVIISVLLAITLLFKRCNEEIVRLTVSQELEYQRLLQKATQRMYEAICEVDITRNRPGSESTREHFIRMGFQADGTYDEMLRQFANARIKTPYIQGYLEMFRSKHLLEAYDNGITNLSYDFLYSVDGESYSWMRANAQIFFWQSDQSVRMITYRQNIDAEKRREMVLLEEVQRDSMTGLYNKRASEQLIEAALEAGNGMYALLLFDIDHFKGINDAFGHVCGDTMISEFVAELRSGFSDESIVGRVGGDEFVVLVKHCKDVEGLQARLKAFCDKIRQKTFGREGFRISVSIGGALYPLHGVTCKELYGKADQALYTSKMRGRSVFTLFDEKGSLNKEN